MALGHGSGFIKSWLAPRLSPAALCPLQLGYCCWRQGSSPQGAGLAAQGRWGPSESGRQTVRLAERVVGRQSQIETPPWKTPPPGGAALGTRPHPCCHSSGARIPVGLPRRQCPSVRLVAGHARRSRGGSRSGGDDGAGPGSGAGVVGRRPACGAATGCMLGPDPHLHHHCLATSSSAAGMEPDRYSGANTRVRHTGGQKFEYPASWYKYHWILFSHSMKYTCTLSKETFYFSDWVGCFSKRWDSESS